MQNNVKTRYKIHPWHSYLFYDADEADGAADVNVVLAVAQDERLGNHDVQVDEVRHDAGARWHL